MKTPTLTDVARHAGVSYATADRVLNARGSYSTKSAEKVRAAMQALGYQRNVAAANLSRGRSYRFVFLLPDGANAFFHGMRDILARRAAHRGADDVQIDVQTYPAFDAKALVGALHLLSADPPDGLAIAGLHTDPVSAALAPLRQNGCAVVSLVSDLPPDARDAYVGIDNLSAGRTAGRLLGMAHNGATGCFLPIVGSRDARDHRDRLDGCLAVLSESYPHIAVLPAIEGRDRPDLIAGQVAQAMRDHPEISAIYSAGAGNRALLSDLARRDTRPFCLVHELVPHNRQGLLDGACDAVIDQRPELEIDNALRLMRALSDELPVGPLHALLPHVFLPDNLPPLVAGGPHEKDTP